MLTLSDHWSAHNFLYIFFSARICLLQLEIHGNSEPRTEQIQGLKTKTMNWKKPQSLCRTSNQNSDTPHIDVIIWFIINIKKYWQGKLEALF